MIKEQTRTIRAKQASKDGDTQRGSEESNDIYHSCDRTQVKVIHACDRPWKNKRGLANRISYKCSGQDMDDMVIREYLFHISRENGCTNKRRNRQPQSFRARPKSFTNERRPGKDSTGVTRLVDKQYGRIGRISHSHLLAESQWQRQPSRCRRTPRDPRGRT